MALASWAVRVVRSVIADLAVKSLKVSIFRL